MTEADRLRVFLCHASNDKDRVKRYYDRLIGDGIDAWLDSEKLLPGQNWDHEIQEAIKKCHVFIVFLTNNSVSKEGYVQKEIRIALDSALEKLGDSIFIIPAMLEACVVPASLSKYHWAELTHPDGYQRLLKSLRLRERQVSNTKQNKSTYYPPRDGLALPERSTVTKRNTIHYPLFDAFALPEGSRLFIKEQRDIFPRVEMLVHDEIKLALQSKDLAPTIFLQELAVLGTNSSYFLITMLAKLLHDYPSVRFKVRYIRIDYRYLKSQSQHRKYPDAGNAAEESTKDLEKFIETSQLKWNERLDFSMRLLDEFPEKTGTLLDQKHLFFANAALVEVDDQGRRRGKVIGEGRYAYCSVDDTGGEREVNLFQTCFNSYWDRTSKA